MVPPAFLLHAYNYPYHRTHVGHLFGEPAAWFNRWLTDDQFEPGPQQKEGIPIMSHTPLGSDTIGLVLPTTWTYGKIVLRKEKVNKEFEVLNPEYTRTVMLQTPSHPQYRFRGYGDGGAVYTELKHGSYPKVEHSLDYATIIRLDSEVNFGMRFKPSRKSDSPARRPALTVEDRPVPDSTSDSETFVSPRAPPQRVAATPGRRARSAAGGTPDSHTPAKRGKSTPSPRGRGRSQGRQRKKILSDWEMSKQPKLKISFGGKISPVPPESSNLPAFTPSATSTLSTPMAEPENTPAPASADSDPAAGPSSGRAPVYTAASRFPEGGADSSPAAASTESETWTPARRTRATRSAETSRDSDNPAERKKYKSADARTEYGGLNQYTKIHKYDRYVVSQDDVKPMTDEEKRVLKSRGKYQSTNPPRMDMNIAAEALKNVKVGHRPYLRVGNPGVLNANLNLPDNLQPIIISTGTEQQQPVVGQPVVGQPEPSRPPPREESETLPQAAETLPEYENPISPATYRRGMRAALFDVRPNPLLPGPETRRDRRYVQRLEEYFAPSATSVRQRKSMALSFFQVVHERYQTQPLQAQGMGSIAVSDPTGTQPQQDSQSSQPEPESIGLDDARLGDSQESIALEESAALEDPDDTGRDTSYFLAPSLVPMTPAVQHRGATPPEPDLRPPSSLNTPAYGPTTTPTPTNTPSSEVSYSGQPSTRPGPVYSHGGPVFSADRPETPEFVPILPPSIAEEGRRTEWVQIIDESLQRRLREGEDVPDFSDPEEEEGDGDQEEGDRTRGGGTQQ